MRARSRDGTRRPAGSALTRLLPEGVPADGLPDVAQLGATTPEAHARRVLRLPA